MNALIESIKRAFGDCKRAGSSSCGYKSSYEVTTLGFFCIYDNTHDEDSGDPVKIVPSVENHQLRVKNDDQKPICLIKTDKCLFTDEHKKCDCIILSNDQCFFVEISDSTNRHRKRNDAVEQLSTTIDILNERGINLSNYQKRAIICFKSGKTRPTQTSFNTKQALFNDKYKIRLEEGNFIVFE
ncbi:MAG: hypothetical protein JNK91_14885 [Ferruginibacter sp.]|nr:hypothetical protein [Ferruginibacter sp.]